jgi:hypothetical protein
MLQAARPFFWHIGGMNDGVLRGASTFIPQFADRHRKLHFIQPDGRIREPERGWLPTRI